MQRYQAYTCRNITQGQPPGVDPRTAGRASPGETAAPLTAIQRQHRQEAADQV